MKNFILLVCLAVFISCSGDKGFPEMDLLQHGVALKINAPAEADVVVNDMGIMKDISIRLEPDYYVQILSNRVNSLDVKSLVSEKMKEVKAGQNFSKLIQEDANGFIFEKNYGENKTYDFRYVKIQGDEEYNFQTGLIGQFTEEQVRKMYNAIK